MIPQTSDKVIQRFFEPISYQLVRELPRTVEALHRGVNRSKNMLLITRIRKWPPRLWCVRGMDKIMFHHFHMLKSYNTGRLLWRCAGKDIASCCRTLMMYCGCPPKLCQVIDPRASDGRASTTCNTTSNTTTTPQTYVQWLTLIRTDRVSFHSVHDELSPSTPARAFVTRDCTPRIATSPWHPRKYTSYNQTIYPQFIMECGRDSRTLVDLRESHAVMPTNRRWGLGAKLPTEIDGTIWHVKWKSASIDWSIRWSYCQNRRRVARCTEVIHQSTKAWSYEWSMPSNSHTAFEVVLMVTSQLQNAK